MSKRKKRYRNRLIVAGVLVVAIGGGLGFRFLRKTDEAIPVQVDAVTRRDLIETVVANGRIQPVTQVVISPEVAGEIIDLPVKEGQEVKKGELLLQIKPDNYQASRNSAEASYKFALVSKRQAEAELERAEIEFKRNDELFKHRLIAASIFTEFSTAYDVAKLRLENSIHQADQARFALDRATDDLTKTTITSPIDGTVTKLKSQLGERVLGTSFNMGTEMMTVAKLDEMEARVDIGEVDIVLIEVGQNARIEVEAFKDQKFKGTVTAIANASKGPPQGFGNPQQEAPKFEVRIRIDDKEAFRPGMSVTAEIETRSRKGVLAVPIQSVTTRLPAGASVSDKNSPSTPPATAPKGSGGHDRKTSEPVRPNEVVFAMQGDRAKMVPVKTGITDGDFYEIVSGVTEGQQIISGGYKAISKDLEDGRKVKVSATPGKTGKETQ
ncbi:MAG TPA: efflux RND transporter periplasmic adaptor subunit [Chthoniobacteraceae bacterium]|nr:efflux RND transporter periplasmic adaptor subunit [Chthoniobacteraceae bacterium]